MQTLDAVIVGAGFSGLYQLLKLRDGLGLEVQVLEAGDGVGGTWYWNRYPGARCDSESHAYCYAFDDALLQEWRWSERYPGQAEILRYLNHVADRFDLRRNIRLNSRVAGAEYDDGTKLWRVRTTDGAEYAARYFITAVGCLSSANIPRIPGLGDFQGQWYHTGEWPHDGVDFTGKRVGQIGTGSTGIQAAPVIAAAADHLTVFQRTANYSIPAQNKKLTEEFQNWVRQNYEKVRATTRISPNGHPFLIADRPALSVSEAERKALYEAAWAHGGLQFRATFKDILTSKAANDTASDFIRAKIAEIVKDPVVAERLTPRDHPFATKRPPIDTGYFETFNRPNVSLVDLRAEPIEAITATGLRTTKQDYPLDIIVFATGFDAMTGPMLRMDIRGRDGVSLAEAWAAGPRTYLGLQVAGFPNMFMLTGPGSPSVLCNMPVAIEQHVEWVADCIAHLRDRQLATIEATEQAADQWVAEVNRAADATLLPQAGSSWYLGANVPGKPRVFMPYAGGMAHYREICDGVAARGYEGFALAG